MAKEIYFIIGGLIGLIFIIGLGIYLGGVFLGSFLKYLLPLVGVITLGKGCTSYLSKRNW